MFATLLCDDAWGSHFGGDKDATIGATAGDIFTKLPPAYDIGAAANGPTWLWEQTSRASSVRARARFNNLTNAMKKS